VEVSQIGEFGLIERLRGKITDKGGNVVVGIGDDAAAFGIRAGSCVLATCDAQIEGVHFLRQNASPKDIGRKAVAINISDIAAMGGRPTFMLVCLGLPPGTDVEFVDELYAGFCAECELYGVRILGGNMARLPERISIDVFLLGEGEKERLLLRSGAGAGELILASGWLGDSAAGLYLLTHPESDVPAEARERLTRAHITPTPRLAEGGLLARLGKVTSAIDVSDGLVSDIGHICRESNVGAEIWEGHIPISDAAQKLASAAGLDPMHMALYGGEDYELVFTVKEKDFPEVARALAAQSGLPFTVIGRITRPEKGLRVIREDGEESHAGSTGWDHFKKTP
jgi:thiamine-monophosphate kinase